MNIRLYDRGYTTSDVFQYQVQKRFFGIWITIYFSDYKEGAIEKFNSIAGPKVLMQKVV